jgi:hypothetical protein
MDPEEESPVPGEPLSAEVVPSAGQPPPVSSPQEERLSDVPRISATVVNKSSVIPKDLNFPGLLAYVADSRERTANMAGLIGSATANLERLIWSVTGVLALAVGSISGLAIFSSHYHLAGYIGLASAAIAAIMSVVGKIRLRKKRKSTLILAFRSKLRVGRRTRQMRESTHVMWRGRPRLGLRTGVG